MAIERALIVEADVRRYVARLPTGSEELLRTHGRFDKILWDEIVCGANNISV
jgi:hypothetical protein